jgi:hypothetical protein
MSSENDEYVSAFTHERIETAVIASRAKQSLFLTV